MDSVESLTGIYKNKFCSQFRESDDDFSPPEQGETNEMIRDGLLTPGTQIEYFVTANYTCTPAEMFLLPDTAGGNFAEFEILPSYRLVNGVPKFPCMLYVDVRDDAGQTVIEHALHQAWTGAAPGDPIPNPPLWDRYDYQGANSNMTAPFARSPGGNNGAAADQLLGYTSMLVHTGTFGPGAMHTADFGLFHEWLTSNAGWQNSARQGFIANGDNFAAIAQALAPEFLAGDLGASLICSEYGVPGCGPASGDSSACVRLEDAPGCAYPSDNSAYGGTDYQYDARGFSCPSQYRFDVLGAAGTGVGNRVFFDYDGAPPSTIPYAQIVNSVPDPGSGNFRTVLDGTSLDQLSSREASLECVSDAAHAVSAAAQELSAALHWIYGPSLPLLCGDEFPDSDVPSPMETPVVTALGQNTPNPVRSGTEDPLLARAERPGGTRHLRRRRARGAHPRARHPRCRDARRGLGRRRRPGAALAEGRLLEPATGAGVCFKPENGPSAVDL